jgi:hypothetical protein
MNHNDIKCLKDTTHWKEVAHFMNKYSLVNVPIVNQENVLQQPFTSPSFNGTIIEYPTNL